MFVSGSEETFPKFVLPLSRPSSSNRVNSKGNKSYFKILPVAQCDSTYPYYPSSQGMRREDLKAQTNQSDLRPYLNFWENKKWDGGVTQCNPQYDGEILPYLFDKICSWLKELKNNDSGQWPCLFLSFTFQTWIVLTCKAWSKWTRWGVFLGRVCSTGTEAPSVNTSHHCPGIVCSGQTEPLHVLDEALVVWRGKELTWRYL